MALTTHENSASYLYQCVETLTKQIFLDSKDPKKTPVISTKINDLLLELVMPASSDRTVGFRVKTPIPDYEIFSPSHDDPTFQWYLLMVHQVLPDEYGNLWKVEQLDKWVTFTSSIPPPPEDAINALKSMGVNVCAIAALSDSIDTDVHEDCREEMKAARRYWKREHRNGEIPTSLDDLLMERMTLQEVPSVGISYALVRSSKGWEVFVKGDPFDDPGELDSIHSRYWMTLKYVAEQDPWRKRDQLSRLAAKPELPTDPNATLVGARTDSRAARVGARRDPRAVRVGVRLLSSFQSKR